MPSSRDAFESQLGVQSQASLVETTMFELWVMCILSLQATPRAQNPSILVRARGGILGEVKVTRYPVFDKAQHNNLEHNVNNHLNVSVLPKLRSIYDPFKVQESILARPHTERLGYLAIERRIIRPVISVICYITIHCMQCRVCFRKIVVKNS